MVASVIAAVQGEDPLVGLYVDLVRGFGISLTEVAKLRPGKDFRQGALHVIHGTTNSHRAPIPVHSDERKRIAQQAIETAAHYNGGLRRRGIQPLQMTRRLHNVFQKHSKGRVRLDDLRRRVVMDADLAEAALCVQLFNRIEAEAKGHEQRSAGSSVGGAMTTRHERHKLLQKRQNALAEINRAARHTKDWKPVLAAIFQHVTIVQRKRTR